MPINKLITLALILFVASCTDSGYIQSEASKSIWNQLEANEFKFIDFSKLGGSKWTKVCFLGPYNESSEKALGFSWKVTEHTDVLKSDGHNVIVFATETQVVEYVVHSRGSGDFWKLSGKCLSRESANLVRDEESGNWRNYVQKRHNKSLNQIGAKDAPPG
ncbi:MAG: hypothetical protein P1U35_03830 [Cycloclasticus sp.]|jgi:hypothetical protein|nr:hypothetical protein [Cycloclasticus sp.]